MRKLILVLGAAASLTAADPDWRVYGGGPENIRYSPLAQIHRGNIRNLQVAWSFDTSDAFSGSEMQCNPLVIAGVLYATTPKLRVLALDAATGKQIWAFDPNEPGAATRKNRNRGLTYWSSGADRRIFFAHRNWLYALDPATGRPVSSFGEAGRVDLRAG